jgi:cellulose synthase/poly-beta-1,6-N-acetylglucosamine synthase-like glycosyltransferase
LPGLLFYQPLYLTWVIPDTASSYLMVSSFVVLLMLGVINSFLLIPSALFLALTVTLLIHKILWALVNRSIYAFQKHELAKRNKLLFIAGIVLAAFGLGLESKALSLLEKLI